MGELFFVCGSVVGAALAWLIGRGDRSRSMAGALTGVSCGLLGVLTSMSGGTIAPMTQAGFGLLGAAAPLTLCVTSVNAAATNAGVSSAVRRYSAALVLALVYGISCATVGFVSVTGARHLSHKGDVGQAADHSILSPTYSGTPAAAFPCCL
jgi:hypothetical protein